MNRVVCPVIPKTHKHLLRRFSRRPQEFSIFVARITRLCKRRCTSVSVPVHMRFGACGAQVTAAAAAAVQGCRSEGALGVLEEM